MSSGIHTFIHDHILLKLQPLIFITSELGGGGDMYCTLCTERIRRVYTTASLVFTIQVVTKIKSCGKLQYYTTDATTVPEFIDQRFHENKPKTLVFSHWKRAFWACFRENWVYNFGHWTIHKWALLSEHVHLLSFVIVCAVQYSIHRTVRQSLPNEWNPLIPLRKCYNKHMSPPPPSREMLIPSKTFRPHKIRAQAKTNVCSDKMSNSDVVYEAIPFWLTATKLN